MRTSSAGLDIIKRFEGLRLEAYLCPAGVWTIGYGHTGDVKAGMVITEHQADVILELDLAKFETGVEALCRPWSPTSNQFSAMVSFAFNVGLGAFGKSTLLRKAKAGQHEGAALEFGKWTKGGGVVLPGLVKRRKAEALLYMKA